MSVQLYLLNDSTQVIFEDKYQDAYILWKKAHITFKIPSHDSLIMFIGETSAEMQLQYDLVLDNVMFHHISCKHLPYEGSVTFPC